MALQKSTITFVVIHEVGENLPHPANLSLDDIAYEMNEGAFLGQKTGIVTVDIAEADEMAEQLALGGDGTLFNSD